MNRRARLPALLGVALAPIAAAEGVPVAGPAAGAALAERAAQAASDGAEQGTKAAFRAEALAREADRLAEMTSVLDGLTTGAPPAAAAAPAPVSRNAAVLFGRPRPALEALIVETALEHASHQGVAAAGLDAFAWRCLFQALVKQESAFNPEALSPAGAYGLAQLMPETAAEIGVDRMDVADNLRGGALYLSRQLASFGRIDHALAAYNAGPGNVRRHGGVPPFAETRTYVARVTRFAAEYGARLPEAEALGAADRADLASGEVGRIGAAATGYADERLETVETARARLGAILAALDEPDEAGPTSTLRAAFDRNAAARAELGRLLAVWLGLRAAAAELAAVRTAFVARERDAARRFLDWRYP